MLLTQRELEMKIGDFMSQRKLPRNMTKERYYKQKAVEGWKEFLVY